MSLKDLRIQKGYSQEKLAELTKLSIRTIQRIEKENKASLESINLLAKVFEISVDDLQKVLEKKERTQKPTDKLAIFISINLMLFIINITTSPEHLWFIYPLLGWGIPFFYRRYKRSYKN
ncbi:MAG: helix-turn-helix domain-containing protein [Campylobacterales bacterium]|nr:helix-turn-helix domain-containing protein [Campylobacterales bacterium]